MLSTLDRRTGPFLAEPVREAEDGRELGASWLSSGPAYSSASYALCLAVLQRCPSSENFRMIAIIGQRELWKPRRRLSRPHFPPPPPEIGRLGGPMSINHDKPPASVSGTYATIQSPRSSACG